MADAGKQVFLSASGIFRNAEGFQLAEVTPGDIDDLPDAAVK